MSTRTGTSGSSKISLISEIESLGSGIIRGERRMRMAAVQEIFFPGWQLFKRFFPPQSAAIRIRSDIKTSAAICMLFHLPILSKKSSCSMYFLKCLQVFKHLHVSFEYILHNYFSETSREILEAWWHLPEFSS
jgi:hypothetical protein